MTKSIFSFALSTALLTTATAFCADTPANHKPVSVPATELMLHADADNGIGSVGPWHLRASYETFDKKGQHSGEGTYEVWWNGPQSYKMVYGGDFAQVEIANSQGVFRSGSGEPPPARLYPMRAGLLGGMNTPSLDIAHHALIDERETLGQSSLRCIQIVENAEASKYQNNASANFKKTNGSDLAGRDVPKRCFDGVSTILRISSDGSGRDVMFFDNIVQFKQHFVARKISMFDDEHKRLEVRLIELASPSTPFKSFEASGDYKGPTPLRLEVPFSVLGRIDSGERLHETNDPGTDYTFRLAVNQQGVITEATPLTIKKLAGEKISKRLVGLKLPPFTEQGKPVEVVSTFEFQVERGPRDVF